MSEALGGRKLGKFELFEELGAGGMGQVYRARHSLIGRDAAVKVLLPRLSNDKEAVSRFFNEARAATMIRHPGIVDIFDFGFAEDGQAFIVMELLEGRSLGQILKAHPRLPQDTICRYMRQAAGALASAHEAGIIHRDLKPDNLFVVADPEVVGGERVKILDFGIAKLSGTAAAENMSKTATGAVLGSPLYMSPEQCEGSGSTTYHSDIYSLGCVMYEMCVGRPPFNGSGVGAIIAKHIYEKPTPPKVLQPQVGQGLSDLVMALMAKDPRHRPANMQTVVASLDRLSGNAYVDTSSSTNRYSNAPIEPHRAPMAATVASIKQTTHGASSGQISRGSSGSRSRVGLWALSLGILVAGAVGAVIISQQSSSEPPEPAAAAAPAEESPVDVTSIGEEAPDTDELVIEAPEMVSFSLSSEPAGALVRDASRTLIGETPYILDLEKGQVAAELIFTRVGYRDSRVSLMPDEDRTEHVVMVRDEPLKTVSKTRKPARKSSHQASKKKKKKKKKKKSGFGETIDPLDD